MEIILKPATLFLLFYVGFVNTFNITDLKFVQYNKRTHICCNGVVHPKPAASSQFKKFTQCCGQHLHIYNSKWGENDVKQESICCGNEIKKIDSKQIMSCCGSDVINSNEVICVNGQIKMNKTKKNQDNQYYYNLCTNKQGIDEIYDSRNQLCCNGHLLTKSSPYDNCCGNSTFNYQTNTCCDEIIYKYNTLCCKNVSYEYSKSRCCNGIIFPVKYDDHNFQCCDKKLYNTETQICCFDYHYNETTFQYEYKYNLLKKDETRATCCHLQLYNPKNEICTENGPQSRSGEKLKKCCGVLFEQVRWNNLWVPVQHPKSKDLEMKPSACGDEIYFDGKRHCFRNKFYQSLPKRCEMYKPGLSNLEYYDPATQICCSGIVVNVTDVMRAKGHNSCCYDGEQDYVGYTS